MENIDFTEIKSFKDLKRLPLTTPSDKDSKDWVNIEYMNMVY